MWGRGEADDIYQGPLWPRTRCLFLDSGIESRQLSMDELHALF